MRDGDPVAAGLAPPAYKYDALERQWYEQRMDIVNGQASLRYDITQAYDKNGNRTGYDKNVVGGYAASYGRSESLSYTFTSVNALTLVTDADEGTYQAAVSCEANGCRNFYIAISSIIYLISRNCTLQVHVRARST